MHNLIIQAVVCFLAIIIAGIKSLDPDPEHLIDRVRTENLEAKDADIQALLHFQQVLKSNLLIINIFLLFFLATAHYDIFQIVAFAFLWLVGVHLLAATAGVRDRAQAFTRRHLQGLLRFAAASEPALKLLDDSRFLNIRREVKFHTRGEFLEAVHKSAGVFTKAEKRQLGVILSEPAIEHATNKELSSHKGPSPKTETVDE